MLTVLQAFTLTVVALAMSMAVGHALEMPGKMRLQQDEYTIVQHLVRAGFAIASFLSLVIALGIGHG